ncbi:bacteriorhodopsin [Micromonospora sp. M12]
MLSQRWSQAFTWNGSAFVNTDTLFSNGYRYMNWSIDVPVLLIQLLVVLGVTGRRFHRTWVMFVVAGLAMIYTGYAGQFYESDRSWPFWIWGLVSTVFFLFLLVLVARLIFGSLRRLPNAARAWRSPCGGCSSSPGCSIPGVPHAGHVGFRRRGGGPADHLHAGRHHLEGDLRVLLG